MIASRNPIREPECTDGINTVHLSDGRRVHLDDITTAEEGQRCLDDLDASMLAIEDQIDQAESGLRAHDPDWRRRAERARRLKGRMRPRLQQRIAELKRAEDKLKAPAPQPPAPKNAQRVAFVLAAEELLDHEVFVEVWARARELRPAAFAEGGRS